MIRRLPVVFASQSPEFARIDFTCGQVDIVATLTALHDHAEHWQARLQIDMSATEIKSVGGVIPRYQSQANKAMDTNRDVLAEWLTNRLLSALAMFEEA